MSHPFAKYAGCGNDFILFDNRKGIIDLDPATIRQLCHRQWGIGADGIILLELTPLADFKMRIFNADGSEAEMCGNGLRCLIKFIQLLGDQRTIFRIEVGNQVLRGSIQGNLICIDMPSPTNIRWGIPMQGLEVHSINTGVPHAVIFMDQIDQIDLNEWGPFIRHHSEFAPQGTNVNLAEVSNHEIKIRTYERGVENETLACGTGATAVALAAAYQHRLKGPLQIQTASKECLTIDFHFDEDTFSNVTMTGPANLIFEGNIFKLIGTK